MGFSKRARTDYIVVHHSATTREQDIGVNEIRRWHQNINKWLDVGYHFIIRRDGTIETGRPLMVKGAHCYSKHHPASHNINATSIAICLVGGLGANGKALNNFTDAQWASLKGLVNKLKFEFRHVRVAAHRKFMPTSCPAFDVTHWCQKNGIKHV